jgi:hypothetical protein
MTIEPLRNKSTSGQPSNDNGGAFASREQRPEASVALERKAETVVVSVIAHPSLTTHVADLPPYPALEAPTIDFGYGDDHPGTLYVYFTIPAADDLDHEVSVTVWEDEEGDRGDSINDGSESTGWEPEVDEQFLEWAHAVRSRLDTDVSTVAGSAISNANVVSSIVANALGGDRKTVATAADGYIRSDNPIVSSAAKAERVFDAYGTSGDLEYDMPDLLMDLQIYADAKGIDFETALGTAAAAYRSVRRDGQDGLLTPS